MDRLSDMIARINNGQKRGRLFIDVLASKFCGRVLDCLTKEGYIRGYSVKGNYYKVYLKYKYNKPVINECIRISKPSHRIYYTAKQLRKSYYNNELIVFTSNKGVFLNNMSIFAGGEALLKIK